MTELAEKVDYLKMNSSEMLNALGADALKWAEAFMQFNAVYKLSDDEGAMLTWFANAMMAQQDNFRRKLKIEVYLGDETAT